MTWNLILRLGRRRKKARETWFLCCQYTVQEALEMGLVNKVVSLEKLKARKEFDYEKI